MNLNIILELSFLFLVAAKHTKEKSSECVEMKDKCYKKEVLINGVNRPYHLSYSHHNHTLYFSYNVESNETKFEIGFIEEKQDVETKIDIPNGFATAIDHKDNVVYLGGSDGVYKHIAKTNTTEKILDKFDIWALFFKHHLYFIKYPNLRLHKYTGDNNSEVVEHIHEKVYQFAIDGEDDIFITNKTGLYMIKNGTDDRKHYKGVTIFRAIAVNKKGEAFFCGQNEIYTANKHNHTLEKVLEVPNIFGLTFDEEDRIIYSDPHQIIKLIPE